MTTGFGWRERVTSGVARTSGKTARRGSAVLRHTIDQPAGVVPLLLEACRRRGCGPVTYIRRAMLSFIAHDLNRPLESVLALDPRFTRPGKRHPEHDPEGMLGGSWEIEDLR